MEMLLQLEHGTVMALLLMIPMNQVMYVCTNGMMLLLIGSKKELTLMVNFLMITLDGLYLCPMMETQLPLEHQTMMALILMLAMYVCTSGTK
jgi:hypothetical protein